MYIVLKSFLRKKNIDIFKKFKICKFYSYSELKLLIQVFKTEGSYNI